MKDRVQIFSFPITEPVDSIFGAIDDLANLARIAKYPLTEQQKIDFAYLILQHIHPCFSPSGMSATLQTRPGMPLNECFAWRNAICTRQVS